MTYKNAIANELFLSVAAHLGTRTQQGGTYNQWAAKEFKWFRGSGMINGDHLVNDGLVIDSETGACRNNGRTIWTYNQGVLVGALAEWSRSNWDAGVLDEAKLIADASLVHFADKSGVLHEPCEPKCGADGVQFKGIFVRNLVALNAVAADARYTTAIAVNAESIWGKSRTEENTFGLVWSGPPGGPDAATQSSALDVMVAAMRAKK
jgi:predicted alpha-1,6-mannanase (GH76 family)